MITEAEKKELIDWISSLENKSMLEHLMELKKSSETDKIYHVSDLEREGIQEGIKSLEEEGGVSHEDVIKMTKKNTPTFSKIKMKIIWSKKAIIDYHDILNFLLLEWSENSAQKFKDQVYFKIQLINTNPNAFEITDFKNVQKIVITKQVTLYFRISDSQIELLRFWNNAKNPENLSL